MTDKNVDKRLFFTLYVEILRAGTEFLWAVEEFRGEGDLIDALESDETRRLRAESASSPLRLAVGRALRLLCTPETGEMNSFTQDQRMETGGKHLIGTADQAKDIFGGIVFKNDRCFSLLSKGFGQLACGGKIASFIHNGQADRARF